MIDVRGNRSRFANALLTALGLAALLALVTAIASTYIGHSPGPYGVCYGASGRSIPCAVSTAHR